MNKTSRLIKDEQLVNVTSVTIKLPMKIRDPQTGQDVPVKPERKLMFHVQWQELPGSRNIRWAIEDMDFSGTTKSMGIHAGLDEIRRAVEAEFESRSGGEPHSTSPPPAKEEDEADTDDAGKTAAETSKDQPVDEASQDELPGDGKADDAATGSAPKGE